MWLVTRRWHPDALVDDAARFEAIRNYWLAEPPLPEQHAIAEFLNCETVLLDAMVAKIETAIERLRECRTAADLDRLRRSPGPLPPTLGRSPRVQLAGA